ncbi:hypothetical protein BHE74_00056118 [Ensete ventricosum]|nr:hypothetical protein BHE74_00056118 [Ensete ventricosum]
MNIDDEEEEAKQRGIYVGAATLCLIFLLWHHFAFALTLEQADKAFVSLTTRREEEDETGETKRIWLIDLETLAKTMIPNSKPNRNAIIYRLTHRIHHRYLYDTLPHHHSAISKREGG